MTDDCDPDEVWRYLRETTERGKVATFGVDVYEWPLCTFRNRFHFHIGWSSRIAGTASARSGWSRREAACALDEPSWPAAVSTPALADTRHGLR